MPFRKYIIIFEILLVVGVFIWTSIEWLLPSQQSYLAEAGVLDLRSWSPDKNPCIKLSGEWEFFPGELFSGRPSGNSKMRIVPDLWTDDEGGGTAGHGSGTYYLTILLPKVHPLLALRWTTISSAATISIDNTTIGSAGIPAIIEGDDFPLYNPQVTDFNPEDDEVVLTVQVSNHQYRSGGLWRDLELGPSPELRKLELTETVTSFVMMAIVLAIAINNLIFFFMQKTEFSLLFFCLFAAIMALRYVVTGNYIILKFIPNIPYAVLIRMEYATLSLGIMTFILFIGDFFGKTYKQLFLFFIPEILFLFLTLFTSVDFVSRLQLPFVALMIPLLLMVFLWVFVPAIQEKRNGYISMIVGISVLTVAVTHDIFTALSHKTGNSLLPGAFLAFICFLAIMLARRFHTIQKHLKKANKLFYRATYDHQTGLYNRAKFFDFFKQALKAESKFAVAMIDMDGLKKLNDSYGHHVGDAAIQEVALRLRNSCRNKENDIAARIGGDEFALILLRDPILNSHEKISEYLQEKVSGLYVFEEITLSLQISIGTAFFPDDGSTPDDLLKSADTHMYNNKRSKKGYRS